MILYTCPARKRGATAPLVQHPCGVAARALDEAGHQYDVEAVGGFKYLPLTRRGRRARIVELTGRQDVPVLLTDDGTVVQGSAGIAEWARTHPPGVR